MSLTAPAANGVHTTGDAIALTASASDAHGVARVEFYDGTTLVATDTASPWSYNWTSAAKAAHTLKAKAFDVYNVSNESSPVSITVQDVESVGVSANPVAGQAAVVTVYGATSGCGAVTVNYGDGDVTTYAIDGLPVSNYHTWATGGSKTVTATGQGNCTGSAQTSVTVNGPPSVSLTAPANNDSFMSPATVSSDGDGQRQRRVGREREVLRRLDAAGHGHVLALQLQLDERGDGQLQPDGGGDGQPGRR